jgi:hypothetical protein
MSPFSRKKVYGRESVFILAQIYIRCVLDIPDNKSILKILFTTPTHKPFILALGIREAIDTLADSVLEPLRGVLFHAGNFSLYCSMIRSTWAR